MAGKRKSGRGFAGQYAVEEVDFWYSDGRLEGLSGTDRHVFFMLNLACVKERRETLPSGQVSERFATISGICLKTFQRAVERIQNKCLIGIAPNGEITVYGVKKRHQNLTWKDGAYTKPNNKTDGANTGMQAVSDKRLRDETRASGAVSRVADVANTKTPMTKLFEDRRKKAESNA